MQPKELDCVLLRSGKEVVILDDSLEGYYLVEDRDVEETGAPPFTIKEDEIVEITYVAKPSLDLN